MFVCVHVCANMCKCKTPNSERASERTKWISSPCSPSRFLFSLRLSDLCRASLRYLSHFLPRSLRLASRSVSVSSVLLQHQTSSLLSWRLYSISSLVALGDTGLCKPPSLSVGRFVFACFTFRFSLCLVFPVEMTTAETPSAEV